MVLWRYLVITKTLFACACAWIGPVFLPMIAAKVGPHCVRLPPGPGVRSWILWLLCRCGAFTYFPDRGAKCELMILPASCLKFLKLSSIFNVCHVVLLKSGYLLTIFKASCSASRGVAAFSSISTWYPLSDNSRTMNLNCVSISDPFLVSAALGGLSLGRHN